MRPIAVTEWHLIRLTQTGHSDLQLTSQLKPDRINLGMRRMQGQTEANDSQNSLH